MAQISSGNGFKLDVPQPKGIVGKEEALKMEEEALAKLQKEKRHSLSVSSRLSSSAPSSSHKLISSSITAPPQPLTSTTRPEKDLIVFPETKKQVESDKFRDIDVDKLTNEELEKLLLDDNFGVNNSKVPCPSSLLGFNLSASYPGGHACSPSPFQSGQWTPVISTPSGSGVSTPTHQAAPLFPSAPFPKPGSFQNGFPPAISPFLGLTAPQPFMAFTPIQTATPIVFQQPPVDPAMAKLLDKIASTSEYLKNGRSASIDVDSASGTTVSLAPDPPVQPPAAAAAAAAATAAAAAATAAADPSIISRFEWLDLDPLTKHKEDGEETPLVAGGGMAAAGGPAGDPWDAVLETEGSRGSSSSPSPEVKASPLMHSQPRRASMGAAVTRSHSLSLPGSSSQHKPNSQVGFVLDLKPIECIYWYLTAKFFASKWTIWSNGTWQPKPNMKISQNRAQADLLESRHT